MDSHMEMGDELQEFYNENIDKLKEREEKVMENLQHLNKDIATALKKLNKTSEEVEWTAENKAKHQEISIQGEKRGVENRAEAGGGDVSQTQGDL